MIEVVKPGLETSIQELPGRIGYWAQGFPPSGPVDAWSFRLANLLVGNARDAAALECQFVGPTLRLGANTTLAVTGADMRPRLDGEPIPMWTSVAAHAGQTLELGAAVTGARTYIAFAGAIASEPVLGSRATFHMAGVGGLEGYALKAGQSIPLGSPAGDIPLLTVPEESRPVIDREKIRVLECMVGPNDDWLDEPSVAMFFASDWSVQARSNRTGIRLTGPEFSFAPKALDKRPEHGRDPSNIIDHGYPLGAVNLAGQTPIILINDAPSTGGFINPFTVPASGFWKLGQARPGNILRFERVTMDEANARRRKEDERCRPGSLHPL